MDYEDRKRIFDRIDKVERQVEALRLHVNSQSAPATTTLREAVEEILDDAQGGYLVLQAKHQARLRAALAADPAPLSDDERRELEARVILESRVLVATHPHLPSNISATELSTNLMRLYDAVKRLDAAKGAKG